MLLVFIRMTGV